STNACTRKGFNKFAPIEKSGFWSSGGFWQLPRFGDMDEGHDQLAIAVVKGYSVSRALTKLLHFSR
ncbi:MAG: hypothetical protein AAFW84_34960, partial [Cyanobacteria bacterium J06635_15]